MEVGWGGGNIYYSGGARIYSRGAKNIYDRGAKICIIGAPEIYIMVCGFTQVNPPIWEGEIIVVFFYYR